MNRRQQFPTILYKYRSANDLAVSLLNGNLYFAPHKALNDPTDLNPFYKIREHYRGRIEEMLEEKATLEWHEKTCYESLFRSFEHYLRRRCPALQRVVDSIAECGSDRIFHEIVGPEIEPDYMKDWRIEKWFAIEWALNVQCTQLPRAMSFKCLQMLLSHGMPTLNKLLEQEVVSIYMEAACKCFSRMPLDTLKKGGSRKWREIENYIIRLGTKIQDEAAVRRERIRHLNRSLTDLREMWRRNKEHVLSQRLDTYGVLCLTSKMDNYGMWTHYADGFRGVCVGFNVAKLRLCLLKCNRHILGPLRVRYRSITLEQLLDPPFLHGGENMFCYKPKFWSYEREFRYICSDGHGAITVPTNCIEHIIVGERAGPQFQKILSDYLTKRASNPNEYKVFLHVSLSCGNSLGKVHIRTNMKFQRIAQKLHDKQEEPEEQNSQDADDIPF